MSLCVSFVWGLIRIALFQCGVCDGFWRVGCVCVCMCCVLVGCAVCWFSPYSIAQTVLFVGGLTLTVRSQQPAAAGCMAGFACMVH